MTPAGRLAQPDLERLSAYLDGALSKPEADRLEARLAQDPELREALEDLRRVVAAVRSLPEIRPPRSFTLRPEVARPRSRAYPVLSFATVVASALFVITTLLRTVPANFSLGASAPMALPAQEMASESALAPQEPPAPTSAKAMETPALQLQAGAAAGTPEPPAAAVEAAPTEAAVAEAPAECPTCPAADFAQDAGRAETEGALRSASPASPVSPLVWLQAGLGLSAVTLLILTLRLRRR